VEAQMDTNFGANIFGCDEIKFVLHWSGFYENVLLEIF
jgi:hypothetical protein